MNPATPQQVKQLLDIDKSFFSKQLRFNDLGLGVGAEVTDSIANRSHFFKQIGDLDVLGLAKYLVIPNNVEFDLVHAYQERGIEIITHDEFFNVTKNI